ncbi:MAG TPA: GNAT family N-acetyltransferase [Naasia sp.]|jgi:ribosomal protein S18 acetylase RimI-like enzyme
MTFRRPTEADHAAVLDRVVEWWPDGRGAELASLLPRLFFQHFAATSMILDGPDGRISAFLLGFRSADSPEVAYIHFVGVDPALRGQGIARSLYDAFAADMARRGCTILNAVTGPTNTGSQAFHRAMGFSLADPVPDYDGPGQARVTMSRPISLLP